ncbi:MAG: tetratricopeptide repeat protein [Bacteroidetes bacterium]|nr:tetratricopeptide repeat protein [Bacteroidota bacterium]
MKHKILLLFFIIISPSGLLHAQQLPDILPIFDEANALVESGDYQDAIDLYLSVIDRGYVSGALYHNLAGAYFRIDEIGQAIRYYQSALRLLGDDPQLIHNIQILETRIQNPFSELPKPFWQQWWDRLFGQHHELPYAATGIGLYVIAFILFAQLVWTNTRNQWHRRLRRLTLGLGLICLLTALLISHQRHSIQGASVLQPTTLTAETGNIIVPEGILVTLVNESELGTLIRLPNGVEGYIDPSVLGDF